MPESLTDRIRSLIAEELDLDLKDVQLSSSLVSLGCDSLERVAMLTNIEEAVGIEIPDDDAAKFVTVRDLVDYAWSRLMPVQ